MFHRNKRRLLMFFQHHEGLQNCIHPTMQKIKYDKDNLKGIHERSKHQI